MYLPNWRDGKLARIDGNDWAGFEPISKVDTEAFWLRVSLISFKISSEIALFSYKTMAVFQSKVCLSLRSCIVWTTALDVLTKVRIFYKIYWLTLSDFEYWVKLRQKLLLCNLLSNWAFTKIDVFSSKEQTYLLRVILIENSNFVNFIEKSNLMGLIKLKSFEFLNIQYP